MNWVAVATDSLMLLSRAQRQSAEHELVVRLVLVSHMPPLTHVDHGIGVGLPMKISSAYLAQLSSLKPAGTGASCSGSAQIDRMPEMPAASIVFVVDVPFATCR